MSKKKIKFISKDPVYGKAFTPPGPASKDIPKWYKEEERYMGGEKQWHNSGYHARFNHSVKACPAVYDSITAGYVFYLDADVYIEKSPEGVINVSQAIDDDYRLMSFHDMRQISKFNFDREYWDDTVIFKFMTGWRIEVPKGYSCLYMHPMWREETPFKILPGIIDQDSYGFVANFFFFIKRGFEGTIPSGTPIGQVIPFKRDEWKHEIELGTKEEWQTIYMSVNREIENGHKKKNYSKKRWL